MPISSTKWCLQIEECIFEKEIKSNLKVYVDDMVVKTLDEGDHCSDLDKIFWYLLRYLEITYLYIGLRIKILSRIS